MPVKYILGNTLNAAFDWEVFEFLDPGAGLIAKVVQSKELLSGG